MPLAPQKASGRLELLLTSRLFLEPFGRGLLFSEILRLRASGRYEDGCRLAKEKGNSSHPLPPAGRRPLRSFLLKSSSEGVSLASAF